MRLILLFLLTIRTFFRVLVISRVQVLENVTVNMDCRSLHGPSFDIAKRTRQVDPCWSKCQTDIADPTLSRYFCQSNASLMQTYIAQAAKDNQIVISIISISTYLTFCIFKLSLFFFFLNIDIV